MKYMLLTYLDEKAWLALSEEQQRRDGEVRSARREAAGHRQDPRPARRCTDEDGDDGAGTRQGKRLVTDGPFAETREQLGGYTIIEAADLDEAIDIAAGFLGDDGGWRQSKCDPWSTTRCRRRGSDRGQTAVRPLRRGLTTPCRASYRPRCFCT